MVEYGLGSSSFLNKVKFFESKNAARLESLDIVNIFVPYK